MVLTAATVAFQVQVVVCESHDTPGGAAHAWTVRAPAGGLYHFESGPSLYSGGLSSCFGCCTCCRHLTVLPRLLQLLAHVDPASARLC